MGQDHAHIHERIRQERGEQDRAHDEYEEFIQMVAQELGATAEAALGLLADYGQHYVLRLLERQAGRGGPRRAQMARTVLQAGNVASARIPPTGGRVVATCSRWMFGTGLRLVRSARRQLESARRPPA